MSDSSLHKTGGPTAGQCLREARERQGLTLEDAARVTRVSRAYLAALEGDQWEKLPSEAYARGFTRIYARYLGLGDDDMPVVEPEAFPEAPSGADDGFSQDEAADEPRPRWKAVGKRVILPIAGGVVAALLLVNLYRTWEEGPETLVRGKETTTRPAAVPIQGVMTSGKKAVPSSPANEKRDDKALAAKAGRVKGSILKLKALEDGELDVAVDDMASQHYELKAGDLFEWKGDRVFSLDLENAGGVEVELNGRVLEPLGERGVPAHVILRAEDAASETAP